jgi:hypothetical protein
MIHHIPIDATTIYHINNDVSVMRHKHYDATMMWCHSHLDANVIPLIDHVVVVNDKSQSY